LKRSLFRKKYQKILEHARSSCDRPASIRTVFMGTPEFALPTLEGLLTAGLDLVGVYTQPDRPSGRGKQLTPPPVKQLAMTRGIPVFQPLSCAFPRWSPNCRLLPPT